MLKGGGGPRQIVLEDQIWAAQPYPSYTLP